MSTFKMIEKLGLQLYREMSGYIVRAEDLESILKSAQVVYGNRGRDGSWNESAWDNDTHTAILLGITPLKKKTKAEAALELVERIANYEFNLPNNADLVNYSKNILEIKDEV